MQILLIHGCERGHLQHTLKSEPEQLWQVLTVLNAQAIAKRSRMLMSLYYALPKTSQISLEECEKACKYYSSGRFAQIKELEALISKLELI